MAESEPLSQKVTSEIGEIKERIEKLGTQLEKVGEKEKEKIIKQTIEDYIKEIQKIPSFSPPSQIRDEAKEIEKFSRPEQVGALVSLALEKGLQYAISVAKNLKNPAILDEFHDVIVDRYFEILVEQHVIKIL